MKNRILKLGVVLALVAVLVMPATVVYAETGSVTVTGGTLSVTPAAISLAATELTGVDLTAASAYTENTWTAKDPVGTGAGWNLTIISTNFVNQNEVQTITITGTPAGGTFTLTYSGNTTAAIAFDATSADVVTALELLENIEDVTATGGALPGTAVVVTFVDPTGNLPMMTATSSLTGGSSPAIAITETTKGKGIDISASDQNFKIQLADDTDHIVVVAGNARPTSSVTSLTAITTTGGSPVKFASAAVDTGMGTYTLKPNFTLAIPAETYAGAYTATFTVTINSGP